MKHVTLGLLIGGLVLGGWSCRPRREAGIMGTTGVTIDTITATLPAASWPARPHSWPSMPFAPPGSSIHPRWSTSQSIIGLRSAGTSGFLGDGSSAPVTKTDSQPTITSG